MIEDFSDQSTDDFFFFWANIARIKYSRTSQTSNMMNIMIIQAKILCLLFRKLSYLVIKKRSFILQGDLINQYFDCPSRKIVYVLWIIAQCLINITKMQMNSITNHLLMFVINSLVGHTYTFVEKNNEIKCT